MPKTETLMSTSVKQAWSPLPLIESIVIECN